MPALDLTEQLPDEILLKVLDSLTLRDLALALGVSRRWRAGVASHPTYFAHPKLESTSPATVAFFIAQITGSRGRSWDVSVIVHEPFPALETAVIPALASRLDDVEVLTLYVHCSHAQAIFEMLREPAVSLLRLQLYFDGDVAVSLPEDILSHGPCLRSLILLNVEIPDTVPPALRAVVNLIFGRRAPEFRTTLRALAEAFPAARDITLTDHILPSPITASDWPEQWQYLDSLMLTVGWHRIRRAVRSLPLSRVVHLTTMHTDGAAVMSSISHLGGALDMCIQKLGHRRFIIHLTSRSSRLIRSFYEFITNWSPPCVLPHELLKLDAAMSRILSLSIPATLWNILVSRMMMSPSITCLTLVLSDPEWLSTILGDGGQSTDSIFPSLGVLTLTAETYRLAVTAGDVTRFVLERLLPHSPLEVRIQGVDWAGPTHVPQAIASVRRIDVTRLYPETPWHV